MLDCLKLPERVEIPDKAGRNIHLGKLGRPCFLPKRKEGWKRMYGEQKVEGVLS